VVYAYSSAGLVLQTSNNASPIIFRVNATEVGRFIAANCMTLGATPDTSVSRSATAVIAFGNGTAGDASATILAKTKAGAPVAADVPASTWALIRDTTNNTTKVYYNNAGTLMSVALT
jgi:tetrahydromethanopterin S-methyltransferase subunit H